MTNAMLVGKIDYKQALHFNALVVGMGMFASFRTDK